MKSITRDLLKKLFIYTVAPFLLILIVFSIILRNGLYENINKTAQHHLIAINNRLKEEINSYNNSIPKRINYSILKGNELEEELKYLIYKVNGLYDIYILDEKSKIVIGESKFYHIESGREFNINETKFQHQDNDILLTHIHTLINKQKLLYRYSIKDILENFDMDMENMDTFIIDDTGKIVYHTNPLLYLKYSDVSQYKFYKEHGKIISGFFPFPSISAGKKEENYIYLNRVLAEDITLGVSMDKETMDSYFNKIYLQVATVLFFYLLILYLIAKYLSHYISKPIILLSKFSSSIVKDEDTTLNLSQFQNNELKTLGENLKESFDTIKSLKDELYKTILSIGDGVIITDKYGNIKIFNKASEEITGYSAEEAIGKEINEIFHIIDEMSKEKIENPIFTALQYKKVQKLSNRAILVTKSGEKRIISDSASPVIIDGKVVGGVLIFKDDTEKERFKGEMIRKQQLETIGLLAGGIAHDFNNILSAIYNYISLLKLTSTTDSQITTFADQVISLCEKGKFLSNRLLTLSKGGENINRKDINIYNLISETAKFVMTGSSITVNISKPDDNSYCCVIADENLLSQVFHNILLNAKQAMLYHGNITISISSEYLEEKDNKLYVKISIKDNGCGIDKENIERIFDPFFTTKKEGSGLGLYIVKSIIEKHDGVLKVFSQKGRGTEFIVYLPFSDKCVLKEDRLLEQNTEYNLNIIIMDDDFFVRDSLEMLLKSIGCKVYSAENGDEAYKIYKDAMEKGEKIDIVFLDVTVPEGKGAEYTLEKIKTLDEHLNAVVMSGYTDSDIIGNYKKYGFIDVLSKPYEHKQLVEILNKYKKIATN